MSATCGSSLTEKILEMNPEDSKMIIGHTVQDKLNSICDDRIWRIDLGLSRAFDDIEIVDYELIEHKSITHNQNIRFP